MLHKPHPPLLPFFSLVLFLSVVRGAGAETPGAPPLTSEPAAAAAVSSSTAAWQRLSSTAAPPGAETGNAAPPAAAAQPRGEKADKCATFRVDGETWLDQTHAYVDRKLCQPAAWFDDFFGNDTIPDGSRPSVLVVMRNSIRWTEGKGTVFVPDYKFRYRLPHMEKLLQKGRFYITSGSTADKFTLQPGQPADPGVDPETGNRNPTMGLRADFLPRSGSQFSLETGIKMHLPIDPFVRLRYQYTRPFAGVYVVRFTEIPLWRVVEHFTETSQLDLERKMSTFTLLRWSDYLTYTEGRNGMSWNTGISLFTQLTPKSAISYDLSMWGVNHPAWAIENYRAGIRYRRNFYRPWLFYELSPEVTWPKDAGGSRNSTCAFMATLEIQFGK